MSYYSDLKEIYNDLKQDKCMKNIFRVMLSIVAGFMIMVVYKAAIGEPITIGPIELNKNKVIHDTAIKTLTIHDTIYINSHKGYKLKDNSGEKINVKSIDQKGGQTANEITNNY